MLDGGCYPGDHEGSSIVRNTLFALPLPEGGEPSRRSGAGRPTVHGSRHDLPHSRCFYQHPTATRAVRRTLRKQLQTESAARTGEPLFTRSI